jgi:transcriptional regulator with XRE-family HTH domain
MFGPVLSPFTTEALQLLAVSIKARRLRRGWSINELAKRVGVSHPTIIKVERGDPTVAVGTVLEAAVLVGVALFDPDPQTRTRQLAHMNAELALLPQAGRSANAEVDDDF